MFVHNLNPVLINLGFFEIRWYSLAYILGILIGWEKPLFQLGVQPFLFAELFKVLIVLFSLSKLKKLNQYLR